MNYCHLNLNHFPCRCPRLLMFFFFQKANKLKLHEKFAKIVTVKFCSDDKSKKQREMNQRPNRHKPMSEMSNENHQYVVDGGSLLCCIIWQKNKTNDEIAEPGLEIRPSSARVYLDLQ